MWPGIKNSTMKAIVFQNYLKEEPGKPEITWYSVADSSLSNIGKPFYIPEDCGKVTVSLGIALKCCKLGKYIEPRFAYRYYKEFAPVLHFILSDLRKLLTQKKLPWTSAVSFDKSVVIGDWRELPERPEGLNLILKLNGKIEREWHYNKMICGPEILIHEFSKMNTIKMGDIMIPDVTEGLLINEGDYLEVLTDGKTAFSVKVK